MSEKTIDAPRIIALASDHAGFSLKENIKSWLETLGYSTLDCGTFSPESVDYPIYANQLAETLQKGKASLGIAICGTGNGISMALNRHRGVRAALCWLPELAMLARQHNNANVLSLAGRFIPFSQAKDIVCAFLEASFEGGRHQRRLNLFD
jgi:ribose-5-phosphate isomerase B